MTKIERPSTSGVVEGLIEKSQLRRRDGRKLTSAAGVLSISKQPTSPPSLPVCENGQCRRRLLRTVIHVTSQNGKAIPVCQRCFVQIALNEAAEGVRRQLDALFVQLRPSLNFWVRGACALVTVPVKRRAN